MTDIETLRKAAALIRDECINHKRCSECPFYGIVCYRIIGYPGSWPVEKIGVEDDE